MKLTPLPSNITIQQLTTAEDLLDHLSPRSRDWSGTPRRWIFRGQGSAEWGLVPSAFRKTGHHAFTYRPGVSFEPAVTHWEQITREMDVVQQFAEEVNRQGAELPSAESYRWIWIAETLNDLRNRADLRSEWPPIDFAPLFALAQHHGVPTRLLDWSDRPHVAAYFAAVQAIGCESETCSVWALNALQSEIYLGHHKHRLSGPRLRILRIRRATNSNLHAQEGVFTLLYDNRDNDDSADFLPLDELIHSFVEAELADGRAMEIPILRKFDLPTSQAGRLLRLLAEEGVCGTTLFPGYDGVVRGLHERGYWDKPIWG